MENKNVSKIVYFIYKLMDLTNKSNVIKFLLYNTYINNAMQYKYNIMYVIILHSNFIYQIKTSFIVRYLYSNQLTLNFCRVWK